MLREVNRLCHLAPEVALPREDMERRPNPRAARQRPIDAWRRGWKHWRQCTMKRLHESLCFSICWLTANNSTISKLARSCLVSARGPAFSPEAFAAAPMPNTSDAWSP